MENTCTLCALPLACHATGNGDLCPACARAEIIKLSGEASSALQVLLLSTVVGMIGLAAGVLFYTKPDRSGPVFLVFLFALFCMGAKRSSDAILASHRTFQENGRSSFIFKVLMFFFGIYYYVLMALGIICMAWFEAVALTLRKAIQYFSSLQKKARLRLLLQAEPTMPVSDGSLTLRQTRQTASRPNFRPQHSARRKKALATSTNTALLHTQCEPIQYMRPRPDVQTQSR